MHLAVVASHPIQYHAPLYRELARRLDLTVFFAHRATPADQAKAGFGVKFEWDNDLLTGFDYAFLNNVARHAGIDRFGGCDTPDIATKLVEGRVDAVLVQGWHLKSYLQAAFAAKRLRLPVLARGDSHLHTPRSIVKTVIYRPFLRLFDAGLYAGRRSREYWMHYGYPEARLFFSPHCVDADWFRAGATVAARAALRARLGFAADTKVILFVGKIVPFKRPLDLIAAALQLTQTMGNVAVLVAGSGELEREMASAAQRGGLQFHHLGFCNQTEMPAVYATADILVLPSDGNETWGLVANEALACGRPIIVSDAAGCAPDLAADGTVGRIFPVGDVAALAGAIRDVLVSPPAPEFIAARSRAYGAAAAADGIEEALAGIAHSGLAKIDLIARVESDANRPAASP